MHPPKDPPGPSRDYSNYPRDDHPRGNYDQGRFPTHAREMDGGGYYNSRRYDNRSPTHHDRYHRPNDRYDDAPRGYNDRPPYGEYNAPDAYGRRYRDGGGGGGYDRGNYHRRPSNGRSYPYDSNSRYSDRYPRSEDRFGEERTLYNPNVSDGLDSGHGVGEERSNTRFRSSGPLYGGDMEYDREFRYERHERDRRTTSRYFGDRPPGPPFRDERNAMDRSIPSKDPSRSSRPFVRENDAMGTDTTSHKELPPSHSSEKASTIHEPELLPSTGPRKILRNGAIAGTSAAADSLNWAEDSDSDSDSDEDLSESEESHDGKEETKVLLKHDAHVPRLLEEEDDKKYEAESRNTIPSVCKCHPNQIPWGIIIYILYDKFYSITGKSQWFLS